MALTGEGGVIDGLTCLRRWAVTWQGKPGEGYCSSSKAGPFGLAGNEDWSAVGQGYGATPNKLPGDTFTFKGMDSEGSGWEGPAIGRRISIIWDVEQANLISHYFFFAGTGQMVEKTVGQLALTDTGLITPVQAKGCGVAFTGGEYSIRRAELTIDCKHAVFNDTDTDGYTGRLRGNFAGNFDILMYADDFGDLPTKNSIVTMTIDAVSGGATKWALNYVFIDYVKGIIDTEGLESGEAVRNSARIRGRWWGWSASIEGYIKTPTNVTIWPT